MANEVKTVFVIDDRTATAKIAAYEARLKNIGAQEEALSNRDAIRRVFPEFQKAADATAQRNAALALSQRTVATSSVAMNAALTASGVVLGATAAALVGAGVAGFAFVQAAEAVHARLTALKITDYTKAVDDLDKSWQNAQRTLLTPFAQEVARDLDELRFAINDIEKTLKPLAESIANVYVAAVFGAQKLAEYLPSPERVDQITRVVNFLATLGLSETVIRPGLESGANTLASADRVGRALRDAEAKIRDAQTAGGGVRFDLRAEQEREREAEEAARKAKRAAEERARELKRQKEEAERLRKEIRNTQLAFIDFAAQADQTQTGNPFVKFFADTITAAERARDQFKIFGQNFADFAANIARQSALATAGEAAFDQQAESLRLRLEARRLASLPLTQIAGFERRLGALGPALDFGLQGVQFRRESALDDALAGRNREGAELRALRDQLRNFGRDARRLESIAENAAFGDLGILGRATLAQAQLNLLPGQGELAGLLDGPFSREARGGLRARSQLNQILAQAADERLRNTIAEQRRQSRLQADVRTQIEQLERNRSLTGLGFADRFLNLTSDIAELAPDLRDRRVEILNLKADLLDQQRTEALAHLRTIVGLLGGGVDVNLNGQAITQIDVKSRDISVSKARGETKPTPADTIRGMNIESVTTILD